MRAMILAAGAGKRMGTLTENTPKPLLKVAGRYLIDYSLQALANAGVQKVVINICYHRDLIKQALGDGHRYGMKIYYSEEEAALETGGGIYQALPLLGDDPFIVMSADVISEFSLKNLPQQPKHLAHIVLVDNPSYHSGGDFLLRGDQVEIGNSSLLTFANIAIFRPEFFANCRPGYFRLGDLLRETIARNQVTGEHYQGLWFNVGTSIELANVNEALNNHPAIHS